MSALRNRQILRQARFSKITCFTHEASTLGLLVDEIPAQLNIFNSGNERWLDARLRTLMSSLQ